MSQDGFFARARRNPSFVAGAVLVLLVVAAAALSLVWTPYPPTAIDVPHKLLEPSLRHWLGTDHLGRDVASEVLAGARISILVGVIAVGIGLIFGVALGLVAASAKGFVEYVIIRFSDFAFAFPALLMAIMLTATFGAGVVNAIIAIGVFNVPLFARVTRASANSVLAREYILAARTPARARSPSPSSMSCPISRPS